MTTIALVSSLIGVLAIFTAAARLALGRGCFDGGIDLVIVRLACTGFIMMLVSGAAWIVAVVAQ